MRHSRRGLPPDDNSMFKGQRRRVYIQAAIVECGINKVLSAAGSKNNFVFSAFECKNWFANRPPTHHSGIASKLTRFWDFSDWQ